MDPCSSAVMLIQFILCTKYTICHSIITLLTSNIDYSKNQDKIYFVPQCNMNPANPTYASHKLNSVLLCPNLHADAPVQLDPARHSAGSTAGAENEVKRMLKADTYIFMYWGFCRSMLTMYEGFVWVEGNRLTTCSMPEPASVCLCAPLSVCVIAGACIWMGLEIVSSMPCN